MQKFQGARKDSYNFKVVYECELMHVIHCVGVVVCTAWNCAKYETVYVHPLGLCQH